MSKRGAERQISQLDPNSADEDDSDGNAEGVFMAAPAAALAGRKIRGLPARKGAGSPAPSAPAAAPPAAAPSASPFSTGFSFDSSAPSPSAASANPFAALVSPASSTSAFTPSSTSAFSLPTAFTPAAPKAAFSFTSSPAALSSPSFSFASSSKAPAATPPALTYYMSLRSLNLSLVESLSAELDKDPFVDLAGPSGGLAKLKERYEEHRKKVENAFASAEGKVVTVEAPKDLDTPMDIPAIITTPPPAPIAATPAAPAASPAIVPWTGGSWSAPVVAKPPPSPPSLPTAPITFSWGGNVVKPSSEPAAASPVGGGFVPKLVPAEKGAEKSAFAFAPTVVVPPSLAVPAPKAPVSKPPPAPVVKLANKPSAPSPLRFGESVSPPPSPAKVEEKEEASPAANGKFSFGASFGAIAKGDKKDEPANPFAFPVPTPSTAPSTLPATTPSFSFTPTAVPAATGTKPFASAFHPTSTPATAFSFSPSSTPAKPFPSSPPITTSFGTGTSPPVFGFGAALAKKEGSKDEAKSPGFAFGGASPGFAFGAGSGSVNGFGFGAAPAATPATTGFAFGAAVLEAKKVTTGFAFGSTTSAPASVSVSVAPSTAGSEVEVDTASEGGEDGGNPFAKGAGEEGEEVLHEVRGRVFRLEKEGVKDVGIAVVAIKEREGRRRLLARNDVTGGVMMNFNIGSSFTVKLEKTFLTFLGFEGTEPVTFRLRVKTKEGAEEMKRKLDEAAAAGN